MSRVCAVLAVLLLSGCLPEEEESKDATPPVRGLISVLVEETERSTIRRYPGVLEPGEVNILSFEVGGRLGRVTLDVGERVTEGQLLGLSGADWSEHPPNFETRVGAPDL